MAKDPAFLFYPGDWMGGTITYTRHEKGSYIDLLMGQFNNYALSLDEIKIILNGDFPLWESKLKLKFKGIDSDGRFFNIKLREEQDRRRSYTESRRLNKQQHMTKHMTGHMETETETITLNEFNKVWEEYPNKAGKRMAVKHFKTSVKTKKDFEDLQKALANYLSSKRVAKGFIQNGSTWFNNWRDWVDYKEEICPKCKDKGSYNSLTGYTITCDCPAGKRL